MGWNRKEEDKISKNRINDNIMQYYTMHCNEII